MLTKPQKGAFLLSQLQLLSEKVTDLSQNGLLILHDAHALNKPLVIIKARADFSQIDRIFSEDVVAAEFRKILPEAETQRLQEQRFKYLPVKIQVLRRRERLKIGFARW